MFLPAILLFVLCLLLSALFSSSETALIAANPYALEFYEKKGSRKSARVRRILAKTSDFLATILIGNTLVNSAAAAIATSVFVSLVPGNRGVILATVATTVLVLTFGELIPKTFAAYNPLQTAFFVSSPVRGLMVLFSPLLKALSFITGLVVPSSRQGKNPVTGILGEEEIKFFLRSASGGLSVLGRKMISGALDIGSRPVKEVMVPRPQVKAIDVETPLGEIVRQIEAAGYSRYPVFKGRLDNIEGLIHTKDIIGYLVDNKEFNIRSILRKPFFVPELASLEKVLLQMQEKAVHMALVVDEFGNVDGIVTLEDILEEIVGEIQDEHDGQTEDWISRLEGGSCLVTGAAPVKEANARLHLGIPEKKDYTTLAGFFLFEFGRIPREGDSLGFGKGRLTVEKMTKRHISLIRFDPAAPKSPTAA